MTSHSLPHFYTDGNSSFSPFNSNIYDLSLIYTPWSNISYKPSFANISTSANYFDLINLPNLSIYTSNNDLISSSNFLFSNLSNFNFSFSNNSINFINFKINQETSFKWSYNNSNIYLTNYNYNICIGTSSTFNKLDVFGSINTYSNYFINNFNISNIFIASNIFSNKSNILYNELSNLKPIVSTSAISSYWSSNSINQMIYINSNIGIGTSSGSYNLNVLSNINSIDYFIKKPTMGNDGIFVPQIVNKIGFGILRTLSSISNFPFIIILLFYIIFYFI